MKVKTCQHSAHRAPSHRRYEWALAQAKKKSFRLTGPRKAILSSLAAAKQPLSSEEVFAGLKKGSSDLVTVYRALSALEEIGLLRRHDFGDGIRRYELTDERDHHHHFIRCRGCGNVEAFGGCEFEAVISRALERKGYRMIHHSLDVQALCSTCIA